MPLPQRKLEYMVYDPIRCEWFSPSFPQNVITDEQLYEEEQKMNNIEQLRNQAAALLVEADRLANLPEEPDVDVIYFKKRFNGTGIYYTYAAVRVINQFGTVRWYVSGASQMQTHYFWNDLIEWICRPNDEWEIWYATELTPMYSSDGKFTYE